MGSSVRGSSGVQKFSLVTISHCLTCPTQPTLYVFFEVVSDVVLICYSI